MSGTVGPNSKL